MSDSTLQVIKYLLLIVLFTLVIIISSCVYTNICRRMEKYKNINSESFTMKDRITGKPIYYLNSNSTLYSHTGEFNMSDGIYDENIRDKKELSKMENRIRELVGAQKEAVVIFNSGASESISTIAHWAKELVPTGIMIGSEFDHSSVKEAAELYNVEYRQTLFDNNFDDYISCVFMTQVNSATGEIMDLEKMVSNYRKCIYSDECLNNVNDRYSRLLPFKPLFVADITQSVTKVPVNMSKLGLNAAFFSTHKIGGKIGHGVLVVNQDINHKFVPLIAGSQNHGLRGGSMSAKQLLEDKDIYDHSDKNNYSSRKKKWKDTVDKFRNRGIEVYTPSHEHLYNTILIDTRDKCPYELLDNLAKKGVYISSRSACMMDAYLNGTIDETENEIVKPFDNSIRISFVTDDEINDDVIDIISHEVLKD